MCTFSLATESLAYNVQLEADNRKVSLEGMNRYHIAVICENRKAGLKERLRASLEINLRVGINSVCIEDSSPFYFTITSKSLDLDDLEIDSSIHDVVDLGMLDQRVKSGMRAGIRERTPSILSDALSGHLVKAAISALLAQSTRCHNQVIHNANHLFASKQDYVRDMCICMAHSTDTLATSVTSKAL